MSTFAIAVLAGLFVAHRYLLRMPPAHAAVAATAVAVVALVLVDQNYGLQLGAEWGLR